MVASQFRSAALLLLTIFSARGASAALLTEGFRIESPVSAATAALVDGTPVADVDSQHWVAIYPGVKPMATAMFTLPTTPTSVGAPVAVARLDVNGGRLDYMRCSIPKEQAEAKEVLGLALDAALEAWLDKCGVRGYEALVASSTPFTAEILASRGFAEAEEVDFAALGRGDALVTHRARLPSAIVAFERRAQTCEDVLDGAMAQRLVDRLRQQPAVALGGAAADDEQPEPKRDPWAGIKGFGM